MRSSAVHAGMKQFIRIIHQYFADEYIVRIPFFRAGMDASKRSVEELARVCIQFYLTFWPAFASVISRSGMATSTTILSRGATSKRFWPSVTGIPSARF